jgi:uncharacterized paraquat-inducible protein A
MTQKTPVLSKVFFTLSLISISLGLYQGIGAIDNFGMRGFFAVSLYGVIFGTAFAATGSIILYLSNIMNSITNRQIHHSVSRHSRPRQVKSGEQKCPHCNMIMDAAYAECPACKKLVTEELASSEFSLGTTKVFTTIDESKNKVRCFQCHRQFSVDVPTYEFSSTKCKHCKAKITNKNVEFV